MAKIREFTKLFLQTIHFLILMRYFVTQIVLTYCEKKNSSDREFFFKFEAEDQEFAEIWRSLEQFIQTVKDENIFC